MPKKWLWALLLAIPIALGGLVFANTQVQSNEQGGQDAAAFICPITGEELPCPKCCPLNSKQPGQKESCCSAERKQTIHNETPLICPLTGEELPCPKCCPLNKNK